ncbi:restriction endonuclease [Candidatus Bathyarchaeota archaeon]|nr:restriction endonuclease [Candidatus Bathyarchaeota archaeon]
MAEDELEEELTEDQYKIPQFIGYSFVKIILVLLEWILFLFDRLLLLLSTAFNRIWSFLGRCSIRLDEISEEKTRRILYLPKPEYYDKPKKNIAGRQVSEKSFKIKKSLPLKITGKTLNGLTASQFVKLVARMLVQMGFKNIEIEERARDVGVDLTAFREDPFGRQQKYAILCKKYSWYNNVKGRQVQVFCSMVTEVHNADQGIFISTSNFSSRAKEIASRFPVELVGRQRIIELLNQYGTRFSESSLI